MRHVKDAVVSVCFCVGRPEVKSREVQRCGWNRTFSPTVREDDAATVISNTLCHTHALTCWLSRGVNAAMGLFHSDALWNITESHSCLWTSESVTPVRVNNLILGSFHTIITLDLVENSSFSLYNVTKAVLYF